MNDTRFNHAVFGTNTSNSSNNPGPEVFLNSRAIANLNNSSPHSGNSLTEGVLGKCDVPTWNDNCLTVRGCGGLTQPPNCGWGTFGKKCTCSNWSFINCYS